MTVDELSAAWNSLRNAALGRGTKPNVPDKLAREVELEWWRWRSERPLFGPTADVLGSVALRKWVTRYRNLAAKVRAAGIKRLPDEPELTTLEKALQGIDKWNKNVALGLGIGAGIALVAVFAKGGGGRAY